MSCIMRPVEGCTWEYLTSHMCYASVYVTYRERERETGIDDLGLGDLAICELWGCDVECAVWMRWWSGQYHPRLTPPHVAHNSRVEFELVRVLKTLNQTL